ncbi:GvpL/GvpF family gas vesicle protein [Acidicapsa ligni]|uniref:GvpL/GvpF family gas vesicle protein n=1 Tax=Acidicapsa ligni TaxID=542300 RepID=UPI0021E05EAB|nr:GvpL/GvpF family gas vesicle protein [Acidicapsa ligni]
MAWYAYCISEKQSFPELARHRKPIPLESVAGIGGNQVFLYPASDLAIVVSEHSPHEPVSQKSGVDHARVIADCFKQSTVLPFRFGTVFQDDESLRKSIRSNQRQFQSNLERLHGKTEMHLKIHVDDCCRELDKHIPLEGVGKEYLSNLRETATRQRERQTRARAVSFQMHRMFAPLDEEVSCRLTESGKMILDIAHLIDRKCVERYQNKYTTTTAMMRECQMQLSGPWPPYHFVHRLTRGAHIPAHAPAHAPAAAVSTSTMQTAEPQLQPALASV